MAKEHAGKVDRAARDGDRAASNGDVILPRAASDGLAVGLERNGEVEVVPVAHHEVLGRGRCSKVWVVALGGGPRLEVECALEGLVALPDLLLRHPRQLAYLAERPRNGGLPAGNEDARRDDGVNALPAQELLLVAALIELLGGVGDSLGHLVPVARVLNKLRDMRDAALRLFIVRARVGTLEIL